MKAYLRSVKINGRYILRLRGSANFLQGTLENMHLAIMCVGERLSQDGLFLPKSEETQCG